MNHISYSLGIFMNKTFEEKKIVTLYLRHQYKRKKLLCGCRKWALFFENDENQREKINMSPIAFDNGLFFARTYKESMWFQQDGGACGSWRTLLVVLHEKF